MHRGIESQLALHFPLSLAEAKQEKLYTKKKLYKKKMYFFLWKKYIVYFLVMQLAEMQNYCMPCAS